MCVGLEEGEARVLVGAGCGCCHQRSSCCHRALGGCCSFSLLVVRHQAQTVSLFVPCLQHCLCVVHTVVTLRHNLQMVAVDNLNSKAAYMYLRSVLSMQLQSCSVSSWSVDSDQRIQALQLRSQVKAVR